MLTTCFNIILCYIFKLKKKTLRGENTHEGVVLMSVHASVILQQLQLAKVRSGRKIKHMYVCMYVINTCTIK